MDNLTHSLFGAVLARCGLAQRAGRGATALLVVASNVPDVDTILLVTHPEASAWLRRTATHSIAGVPLLAMLLALAWWAASRGRSGGMTLGAAAGLSLLGAAGHVALDLVNSYGVVVLWPFSSRRFELAWIFIIDLALLAILLSPYALRLLSRRRLSETRAHQAALAVFLLYVAACAAGRAGAVELLQRELDRQGARPTFTYVFPEALGPHRWRGVALEDSRWRTWLIHLLGGHLEPGPEIPTQAGDPRVLSARSTGRGQDVERFFKAPVWTVAPDGRRATCTDLRFLSLILDRDTSPFRYEFELEPELEPELR